jgi:hypothetical protein
MRGVGVRYGRIPGLRLWIIRADGDPDHLRNHVPPEVAEDHHMKAQSVSRAATLIIAVLLVQAPTLSRACTACMGDSNTQIAEAANAAIFLMLGVLLLIFSLLGAFAYALYRRGQNPIPSPVNLAEIVGGGAQPEVK